MDCLRGFLCVVFLGGIMIATIALLSAFAFIVICITIFCIIVIGIDRAFFNEET